MRRYSNFSTTLILFTRAAFCYLLIIQARESCVAGFHINRQAQRIVKPIASFFIGSNKKQLYTSKFQFSEIQPIKSQRLPSIRSISSLSETTSAVDDSFKRNDQYKVVAFMRKFLTVLWRWASFPMRLLFSSSSKNIKEEKSETKTAISDDNINGATPLMADTIPTIEDVENVDLQTVTEYEESIEKETVISAASSSVDSAAKIDEVTQTNTTDITMITEDISSTIPETKTSTASSNVKIDNNIPADTKDITITKEKSYVDPKIKASTIKDSDDLSSTQDKNGATYVVKPKDEGNRWAVGAVDMSGEWQLMDTDEFKQQYEYYLKYLGQPAIVRAIALGIVGFTTESTKQSKEGRELLIRGRNTRGGWERCLVSSGTDADTTNYEPIIVDVRTADGEMVKAESWWEDDGEVHRSWMRGVTKYGGGDFESKRYLENDGKVLVCESTFHPIQENREKVLVTWKFLRKGERI